MSALLAIALAALASQDTPTPRKLTAAADRRIELDLTHYYKQSELGVWLNSLASAYPEFTRLESLGKSAGGEELWLMTIAEHAASDPASRPALLVAGALGREDLFGTEMALATMLELVQNHARDEHVAELLERVTIYVAPCVNPDLRSRVFAELEGTPFAAARAAEVDLEQDFPIGWEPSRGPQVGPYPLFRPESRALADFLLGHPNVALVHDYARSGSSDAPNALAAPPSDGALLTKLAAAVRARSVAEQGPFDGDWLDFAYGQLGCPAFSFAPPNSGGADALPSVDALYTLARDCAPATLALASSLPRLELDEPAVEHLHGEQWRVRVALSNAGALPTLTELGRERFACPGPRIVLEGARIVAAVIDNRPLERVTATLALSDIEPAGRVEVAWIVAAPEGTELVLSASAPRAGVVSKRVALR